MNRLLIFLIAIILIGCSESSKELSTVYVGMTGQEVLSNVGEPDKKYNVGIAEFWVYSKADRTVVFRKDTVYDVITSAEARIDSIKTSLDNFGDKVENQAENAADKLDSVGRNLKKSAKADSLIN